MWNYGVVLIALIATGCAPLKDFTAITGVTDAFTKEVSVAPAYFQNLANDYLVASDQHRFLTGQSCDSIKSNGIADFRKIPTTRTTRVKGTIKVIPITYAEYERDRLAIKSQALDFLSRYAKQIRDRAEAAESFSAGISFASSTADIAASIPVVGATALPYTAAAQGILKVLDRFNNDASAFAIQQIAIGSQKKLETMIESIKADYGIINVDAKIYLTAWKDCDFARIKAMRSPLSGVTLATAVEIDTTYAAHLAKLVSYQKSIPTLDDELDAIVEANNKIAKQDYKSVLSAAQELVGASTAAYTAIQAVQKLN